VEEASAEAALLFAFVVVLDVFPEFLEQNEDYTRYSTFQYVSKDSGWL